MRLRQSSASSFAARLVEPTRSQNITVIGRRSADIRRHRVGLGLGGEGATLAEGVSTDRAAIAARSLRRSPTAESPMSLRSSAVNCGSTSASILLSRKFASYWPRPRLRSHPPTSMAALHMVLQDHHTDRAMCPAAWLTRGRARCFRNWLNLAAHRWGNLSLWRIPSVAGLARNVAFGSVAAVPRRLASSRPEFSSWAALPGASIAFTTNLAVEEGSSVFGDASLRTRRRPGARTGNSRTAPDHRALASAAQPHPVPPAQASRSLARASKVGRFWTRTRGQICTPLGMFLQGGEPRRRMAATAGSGSLLRRGGQIQVLQ